MFSDNVFRKTIKIGKVSIIIVTGKMHKKLIAGVMILLFLRTTYLNFLLCNNPPSDFTLC